MCISGHVDGLFGEGVLGWACVPDEPERRLWVELLVDDCPVGIGRAENHHEGAASHGDGYHGFWLPLPPALRDAESVARVRVANTDCFLEPAVTLHSPKPKATLLGAVRSDMGVTLSGWVCDPAEPQRILRVCAWLDGKRVVEVSAHEHRFRPEIADGHGFSLTLPLELADGKARHIDVLDEEKRPIPGSPVLVCAVPHGMKDWFASQKKLDAPQRAMVSTFLDNYEQWLPRGLRLDEFEIWQTCFPTPEAIQPKGTRIALVDGRAVTAETLHELALSHDFLLWHDGERLHPHIIGHMTRALTTGGAALVYADSARRTANGKALPQCKAAWDIHRFLCDDFLGPFLVRAELANKATSRTQLILAAHDASGGICHLPQFLSENDVVPDGDARRIVLQTWLNEKVQNAHLTPLDGVPHLSRIHWPLSPTPVPSVPLVSVLIPTRDRAGLLRACLTSLDKTSYPAIELVILDNGSTDAETLALLRLAKKGHVCRFPVRVVACPGPFNYADINNSGAREASGALLCLLNNDTEIVQSDWLHELVGIALNPLDGECVGAAGAKLLWPNHLTQHAGVVVGTHQLAAHIGNQWPAADAGYMNLNLVTRQVSAVTAACMLTPRKLFLELGGFDAGRFPVAFNDVDYCLRLREAGKRIVWTPHAKLIHHESASRGHDESPAQKARSAMEMQHFRSRWGTYADPFYNPNLSLSTVLEPFAGLALPPRHRSFR